MFEITRSDMTDYMEKHGAGALKERPQLNWSRVDAYVVEQSDGYIDAQITGFQMVEAILSGKQRARYDSKFQRDHHDAVTALPGMVQFQTADAPTQIEMEGKAAFLQILIDDSIFCDVWTAMKKTDPREFETWSLPATFDENIRRTAMALLDEMRVPSLGGELYAEVLAQQLAVLILRRQHGVELDATPPHALSDRDVARVVEYIHTSMDNPGGLATLAELIELDTHTFSRGFQAKTGLSPHKFLIELRMTAAKELLVRTRNALKDIAAQTGFSSMSHMDRLFRKYTGRSARDYRDQAVLW